jgi:hypothetical protein
MGLQADDRILAGSGDPQAFEIGPVQFLATYPPSRPFQLRVERGGAIRDVTLTIPLAPTDILAQEAIPDLLNRLVFTAVSPWIRWKKPDLLIAGLTLFCGNGDRGRSL